MAENQERVERFAEELREGPEPSDRSIREIIEAIRPELQELTAKQVQLARTEMTPVGKQAGVAAGLLATGAVFMLLFLGFFFATTAYAMYAAGFPAWVAAGIVTVVLLIIGGIFAGSGAGILRRLDPKPHRTIAALQQNIEWLKGQFRS